MGQKRTSCVNQHHLFISVYKGMYYKNAQQWLFKINKCGIEAEKHETLKGK